MLCANINSSLQILLIVFYLHKIVDSVWKIILLWNRVVLMFWDFVYIPMLDDHLKFFSWNNFIHNIPLPIFKNTAMFIPSNHFCINSMVIPWSALVLSLQLLTGLFLLLCEFISFCKQLNIIRTNNFVNSHSFLTIIICNFSIEFYSICHIKTRERLLTRG